MNNYNKGFMKKMIIASTSTVYGGTYLAYLTSELEVLFSGVEEILFIPYARPGGISHDNYTEMAAKGLAAIGKKVKGIHEFENPVKAVEEAQGIFTGGGNTFLLVTQLYQNRVMETLREVIYKGTPYLGSSAGSNITGLTMQTTNDMPIVYPPSFKTIGAVPFNINPHYLDQEEQSKHMGESRATRIKEFHFLNSQPVIGLREGSWLQVEGNDIWLRGNLQARIFEQGKVAYEIPTNTLIKL